MSADLHFRSGFPGQVPALVNGIDSGEIVQFNGFDLTVTAASVPEIDAASGGAAITLLLGVLALVSERRRWRASELAG
jgi:hypothetical protein